MFNYFVIYSEHNQRWHVARTPMDNSSAAFEIIGPPYVEFEDAQFFLSVIVEATTEGGEYGAALNDFLASIR